MSTPGRLSHVAQDYLAAFCAILDDMIRDMTQAELTDSISHNFIVQMIPHHRAAIEMSNNILKYTTNVPLQEIATQIVSEQTKSIEDMHRIEASCSECRNTKQELFLYQRRMDQILQTMFTEMGGARGTNRLDCDFMWEMIPHHRGAVRMANNALCFAICPGLKPILHSIITSQERGIRQMNRLLQRIGCPIS